MKEVDSMPLGDGTGPLGQGPSTGRGAGFGRGRGRMGGSSAGAGIGGYCVCPNCSIRIAHQTSKPCYSMKCPKCGTQMARE